MNASNPPSRDDGNQPVISIEDVTFAYADRPVLEEVALDIEAGTFLGLVGPNGSGKTTLLELILGLRRPDRGSVQLFGEPAQAFDDGERIGYVPQHAAKATGRMPVTVREAVTMGRYPHQLVRRFSAADRKAVDDALDQAGIAELSDRRVGKLSGGQRQRVFLARVLAAEADLLALDEPTIGVDAESRERFYGLLGELNARGLTIVLIEHDIGVVTEHATEVACLNRHLYFDGEPDEFVATDALADAYGTNQHVLQHGH